jgi:hypothetical protein
MAELRNGRDVLAGPADAADVARNLRHTYPARMLIQRDESSA